MIGLGGWGGRNEKNGPYVYWKDGKIVRDTSKGPGGSHGAQNPFLIEVRQPDHPIAKGLPEKFRQVPDELYSQLRGPARNLTVLATAYADRKFGGTGRSEPILMTIAYGKGRVFHTTLGHDAPQCRSVAFIVTLQRGAEWAATGKVTQTVPADFPGADHPSVRN
jgi:type 1 glutamine amidotransferase